MKALVYKPSFPFILLHLTYPTTHTHTAYVPVKNQYRFKKARFSHHIPALCINMRTDRDSLRPRMGAVSGGRRLAEECPALMATPALILHGDRSLRRANTNGHPGISSSPSSSAGGEGEASRSDGPDRGESTCLVQAGISGDVSPERRRSMGQGGRRDRILGWKMELPTDVELVKVCACVYGADTASSDGQ